MVVGQQSGNPAEWGGVRRERVEKAESSAEVGGGGGGRRGGGDVTEEVEFGGVEVERGVGGGAERGTVEERVGNGGGM